MKKVALMLLIGCAISVGIGHGQENPKNSQDGGAVKVQMHNVMYHFTDQIAVHLINVGGSLVPTSAGHIPVFDDKNSFELQITAAEMTMDPQSLANVLNSHVFSANDAPLKDISVTIENGKLKVKGKLHYFGPIARPQEALDRWLAEKYYLLAGRQPPRPGEPAEPTLEELVNRFLTSKKRLVESRERSPWTLHSYEAACQRLLEAFGWNRPLTPEERAYIPPRYANLPTLGRLTGRGNTANVEVMLASRPDVIIDYGVVNPTYVSLADRVQQQTGVPYLLFDGSLSQIPRAYIAAGESLGVGERAKELARYAEGLLAEIDERLAQVPAEKRPLVYYARGPRGLQTGLKGSINVESLERIGARNIAAERMGPGGIVTVSPEQLLAWNPEVVITIDSDFFGAARSDDI